MAGRRKSAHRLAITVATLSILAAAPAVAQDTRRVSVGAAAGAAMPFHGDFDFMATAWQADVRVDSARHFGFSVFVDEWRHTDERELTDQPIAGPGGLLGRAERVTTRTSHRTRAIGWSLVGRGTAGRVTFTGGGGVSYLRYSREFSQEMAECEPASLCRDSSSRFASNRFATQAEGGVDVALGASFALMGQVRLVIPVQDPGSGHVGMVGGVRVVF
jgi:hypothetical protein